MYSHARCEVRSAPGVALLAVVQETPAGPVERVFPLATVREYCVVPSMLASLAAGAKDKEDKESES